MEKVKLPPLDVDEIQDICEDRQALITQVEGLKAQIAALTVQLAECYHLSGADPDGAEDWRLAPHAVTEVRRLREESESEISALTTQVEELKRRYDGWIDMAAKQERRALAA